jgi:hypothetical protein
MLNQATLDKMQAMKLSAMVDAFEQQTASRQAAGLSFEERLGLLVDAEWTHREQRKLTRRLKGAKLRYPACLIPASLRSDGGRNPSEPVAAFARNGWAPSFGPRGRLRRNSHWGGRLRSESVAGI